MECFCIFLLVYTFIGWVLSFLKEDDKSFDGALMSLLLVFLWPVALLISAKRPCQETVKFEVKDCEKYTRCPQ